MMESNVSADTWDYYLHHGPRSVSAAYGCLIVRRVIQATEG